MQGDVGCGKTVVAFLACMEVIGSGYQVSHFILLKFYFLYIFILFKIYVWIFFIYNFVFPFVSSVPTVGSFHGPD